MTGFDAAVRVPFAAASAVRRARIFHPHGIMARGHGELESPWWPQRGRVPVTARLSRGLGLPGAVPDILGLALRFHLASGPWDVLLATSLPALPVVLCPARSWASAHYSSIAPYRTDEDRSLRWVTAEPEPGRPSTANVAALGRTGIVHFGLSLATVVGVAQPAGRVSLEPVTKSDPLSDRDAAEQFAFDPVVHRPTRTVMWPKWIASARLSAYRGSREGRHATLDTATETRRWREPDR